MMALAFVASLIVACSVPGILFAQDGSPAPANDSGVPSAGPDSGLTAGEATAQRREALNLLVLLTKGGGFMIPLGLLSVLVIGISIERMIALRKSKVLPPELVTGLGKLSRADGGFDPRDAYKIATSYPSAASSILQAMLMKVGRPQTEVEHAVQEASQREADRMHYAVRWLTLCASVAPLVGLLGTVWGMIQAFYDTTQLVEGQDKAEQLAAGIYTALITTLCGLVIAIPAAIFAQFFESRISSLFHQIDEMLFNLMPQVERFEGRVRFSRTMDDNSTGEIERRESPTQRGNREGANV